MGTTLGGITGLKKALWETDLVSSRVALGLAEILWAIMLAWPGDTFSRPTYAHMAMAMCEEWWSVVFTLSSLCQLYIVATGKFHARFARSFALWNACLWSYVVWSMLASVYPPPAAIGGEISLSICAVWICIRPYILAEVYTRVRK